MNTNKQLMFSLITGDIYTIESDEIKNMDKYQIPLKKRPSNSCNKCFGRFYIGYNITPAITMARLPRLAWMALLELQIRKARHERHTQNRCGRPVRLSDSD